MKRDQLPLYAVAFAVIVVGLAFASVPLGTLLLLPLFLACPIMMMLMMGGMNHGDTTPHEQAQPPRTEPREHSETPAP